ncbi:acyl carrier protein [Amylibacter sp.]|nr:acyl carrier protein [Amylibacter sp.]
MTSDDNFHLEKVLTRVKASFQKCFKNDTIDIDTDFFELGGDSLQAQKICLLLEQHFNIIIHPSLLFEYSCPRTLAEYLIRKIFPIKFL